MRSALPSALREAQGLHGQTRVRAHALRFHFSNVILLVKREADAYVDGVELQLIAETRTTRCIAVSFMIT